MIDRHTTHKSLFAVAVAALLLGSCSRQPNAEERNESPRAAPSATSSAAVEISETAAQDASPTSAPAARDATTDRDPDALKALERMGAYLRTLKAFQIHSQQSRDEVLDDGQNIEFGGVVDMLVERPNRLRAEVTSDKQQRFYFADGRNFSVWARRVNYYATIPAPPTLRELANTLADKYDLELPVADLFYWGDRKDTDDIVAAIDVGASQIDGVTCEHYAFRQEGVDWQVWVQQGDYPLPRKLVITTTTDPARPQFTSMMTWNLAPSYNDSAFNFVPPKDAKRIAFAPSTGEPTETGTSGRN
jgi:hypothetical protein